MPEDVATRRKRLRYRSLHRGTKELDLILGGFATRRLDDLSGEQLDRYEAIIESEEQLIYAWIAGREPIPEEHDNDVMRLLLAFRLTGD